VKLTVTAYDLGQDFTGLNITAEVENEALSVKVYEGRGGYLALVHQKVFAPGIWTSFEITEWPTEDDLWKIVDLETAKEIRDERNMREALRRRREAKQEATREAKGANS